MKKWSLFILVGGILIMLVTFSLEKNTKPLATWLWDATLLEQPQSIIDFLQQQNFTTVYVQIDPNVSQATYAQFINLAQPKNINVHALHGAPDWITTEQQPVALQFFEWLETYQSTFNESPFDAIHLDVEPYLHPTWKTDEAQTIESFQLFIQLAQQHAKKLQLSLIIDVPFWFDDISFNNQFGQGTLVEWIIKQVDGITIMAYRDSATDILAITQHEINYSQQFNKQVTIGIETMPSEEGDFVSFAKNDIDYLQQQLMQIESNYKGQTSFNGFAIHHYESFKEFINK